MKILNTTRLFKLSSLALTFAVVSSCVPSSTNGLRSRINSGSVVSSANVGVGQGKVLLDNPIALTKNPGITDAFDLNKILSVVPITDGALLEGGNTCADLDYCFEVKEKSNTSLPLQTTNGKWAFKANTPEFLQVNTYYHLNKINDMFYTQLRDGYDLAYLFTVPQYDSALPLSMFNSGTGTFKNHLTKPLSAYADCDLENNASYDHANNELCLGYLKDHNVKFAHDSTIIYHEAGHFFQKLQLNLRNPAGQKKADMGRGFYDEASSLGEGLSDFFSFYVNGRTHFAEWAAGRYLSSDRPMTEDDPSHATGISSDADQRLSYPQYLDYSPYSPTIPTEDVHLSGMIISHFLTALTADLRSTCSMDHREASNVVFHLINETMAELGDLTANGTQSVTTNNKVNMSAVYSSDWFNKVNPINFRSFAQTFGKNMLTVLGNPSLIRCGGMAYSKDQIETLLDQYGLLLFRTYNQNRSLSIPGDPVYGNTTVNAINRKKSVLISKNLITFDPSPTASMAFVIDDRAKILAGITQLQANGYIEQNLSLQTPTDLGFNNNNSKVSPGEVVAIGLNLYNNSNSTMGGVQILANDWNHADATGKPCLFSSSMSNDNWPLLTEGGVDTCTSSNASAPSDFAPVCFVQLNESNSTRWVSQKEFKSKIALNSSQCLNPANDKDCFIRAVKGADQATYSKLNPKSTWGKTLTSEDGTVTPELNFGNVLLFEVSKHIPPGTVVDCRLRVRFTNCEECYHDSLRSNYDYKDKDYNGPRPYKVIHLQIPIVD